MMKLSLLMIALAACGGGGSSSIDAATDGKNATVDAPKATDAAPGGPTLTIKNFESWCNVTVNGGTASSLAVQAIPVTAGTINVSAVALTGFELGTKPWHDTAGDTAGTGEQGTLTGTGQAQSSATTVVVGATGKCIWVCCPFSNPPGTGCPTTDQCP